MSALISGGEVIHIHLGGAGVNTAAAYWQILANEHHLVTSDLVKEASKREKKAQRRLASQVRHQNFWAPATNDDNVSCSQNLCPFFDEVYQRYVPRAIFVDNDPSARYGGLFDPANPLKHFFRKENFVFGTQGSSGLRSVAIEQHAPMLTNTLAAFDKELERADHVQSVQLTHHLGGGTGSGLSSLVSRAIKDEYGMKSCHATYLPTFTDIGRRNSALELYNAALSIPDLAASSEYTLLMDNEALYDICFRLIGLSHPGYRDLNHLVAAVLADFTACMRFPVASPTMPYRLYSNELAALLTSNTGTPPFALAGFGPLTHCSANVPIGALLSTSSDDGTDSENRRHPGMPQKSSKNVSFQDRNLKETSLQQKLHQQKHRKRLLHYNQKAKRMPTISELLHTLFTPSNAFLSENSFGHIYTSAVAVFRGGLTQEMIQQEFNYLYAKRGERFRQLCSALPDIIFTRICPEPQLTTNMSVSWAGCSSAFRPLLAQIKEKFAEQYRNKIYVYLYEESGVEPLEFQECQENIQDLLNQYDLAYCKSLKARKLGLQYKKELGLIPYDTDLAKNQHLLYNAYKPVRFFFDDIMSNNAAKDVTS